MEKLLTISIAAYNVEKYLEKALKSCVVKDDLLKLLEVCIVDDGSEDNTSVIAKKYIKRYPNLFKLYKKENGGYGSTVNYSISVARGKYFRLLDGDDWYDKEELEKYLYYLQQCDSDLVLSDYSIIYEKSNRIAKKRNFSYTSMKEYHSNDFDNKSKMAMYSFCYKTKLLKEKQIVLTEHCFYTDMEFMLLPLRFISSFVYIKADLYQYRIGSREQSVSIAGMKKHYRDYYKVFRSLYDSEVEYVNSGKFTNNIDLSYKNNIFIMAKASYWSLLCLPISINSYRKINKLSKDIKKCNLDFTNKNLGAIRISSTKYNFIIYIFDSLIVKILTIIKLF